LIDLILAPAVAAGARRIITGEKDPLALGRFGSIPIIRPGEFKSSEEQENPVRPGPSGQDP
jgi:predicted nucleic acid-binding protein